MKTITLALDRNLLAACLITAAKSGIRYYLNGVCVEINKGRVLTIATDGHRLSFAKHCTETYVDTDGSYVKQFDVILPRESIEAALKLDKKSSVLGLTLTRQEHQTGNAIDFTLGPIAGKTIDGVFPNWRRVVPNGHTGEPAQINPEYVADLGKAAKALGGKAYDARMLHNGNGCVTAYVVGHENYGMAIMPYTPRGEVFKAPGLFAEFSSQAPVVPAVVQAEEKEAA
jgi:hypothetical protein